MTGRWGLWGEYDTESFAAARCRELNALPADARRHYEFRQVGRRIYARSDHPPQWARALDQLIVMQAAGHIPPPYTPHVPIGATGNLF